MLWSKPLTISRTFGCDACAWYTHWASYICTPESLCQGTALLSNNNNNNNARFFYKQGSHLKPLYLLKIIKKQMTSIEANGNNLIVFIVRGRFCPFVIVFFFSFLLFFLPYLKTLFFLSSFSYNAGLRMSVQSKGHRRRKRNRWTGIKYRCRLWRSLSHKCP